MQNVEEPTTPRKRNSLSIAITSLTTGLRKLKSKSQTFSSPLNPPPEQTDDTSTPRPSQNPPASTPSSPKPSPSAEDKSPVSPARRRTGSVLQRITALLPKSEQETKLAPPPVKVGAPKNVKHNNHLNYSESSGFVHIPPEWKKLFLQAGVTEEELQDRKTAKYLMKSIVKLHKSNMDEKCCEDELCFQCIMKNDSHRSLLRTFLKQNRNQEQMVFLDYVREFKRSESVEFKKKLLMHVTLEFVEEKSARALNLPETLRNEVVMAYKQLEKSSFTDIPATIFANIEKEIMVQLQFECYNAFKQSKYWATIIEKKQKVKISTSEVAAGNSSPVAGVSESPSPQSATSSPSPSIFSKPQPFPTIPTISIAAVTASAESSQEPSPQPPPSSLQPQQPSKPRFTPRRRTHTYSHSNVT